MVENDTASLNRQIRQITAERDALQLQVAELVNELRQLGKAPKTADNAADGGQFDAAWYRQQYPDVDQLGMDPQEHYDWIGRRLGRAPNARAIKKKVTALAGFWQTPR
ncbi:hypothetical protein [Novosphingobium sp.]|uniref:hypothetical protein n=1 Tax=Novosphingobium sp. TaxID=1874826 RepID=UPI0035B01AB3